VSHDGECKTNRIALSKRVTWITLRSGACEPTLNAFERGP